MTIKEIIDYLRGELSEGDWEYMEIHRNTVVEILEKISEAWSLEDDLK